MGLCCSTFLFKIPQRCSIGFRWHTWPGHSVNFFFFTLETLAWFWQCDLDCYHAGIFLFCQASGDWESSCQPVFWYIHMHSWCHLYMSSPQHLWHSCSPISSHYHLCGSLLRPCIHCGGPGQVHTKHAGPHLSQSHFLLDWRQVSGIVFVFLY